MPKYYFKHYVRCITTRIGRTLYYLIFRRHTDAKQFEDYLDEWALEDEQDYYLRDYEEPDDLNSTLHL